MVFSFCKKANSDWRIGNRGALRSGSVPPFIPFLLCTKISENHSNPQNQCSNFSVRKKSAFQLSVPPSILFLQCTNPSAKIITIPKICVPTPCSSVHSVSSVYLFSSKFKVGSSMEQCFSVYSVSSVYIQKKIPKPCHLRI